MCACTPEIRAPFCSKPGCAQKHGMEILKNINTYFKPMGVETDLRVERVNPNSSVALPTRGSAGAAGIDFAMPRPTHIASHKTVVIPCGFKVALPPMTVGLMRARGSAIKKGLRVDGTVDCDYRGELHLCITNNNTHEVLLNAGERVAQMVIVPACLGVGVVEGTVEDDTVRGAGSFGSTGA